ncbi:ABC transporter ATP-binding protein [Hazenella coriacea]|uniref:ABC-type multidrug transport system ATPase subunit n=1 Tax=Hazenella coriacea TaxID=1179467 RepID=A0A4R3L3V7_9BACL|nr:ABC transporter ATP-binding protein [Hazenella coriacea]TCS93605.1 ABC-type multidrug transport system ATPase subunit [Hazenella coriacea]
MDKTIVEIKEVSKVYAQTTALEPLTLSIPRHHCLVLCGGNGAGKSTLIQLLAGIIPPSSGKIELDGVDLWKDRTNYVKRIGYMPDDFQLPTTMTVQEFLSFYASLRQVSAERVEETLNQVGLIEKKAQKLTGLSKGMRQRLLFAQAILGKPELLLLDEPTNGLDPYWMKQFIQLIDQLKEERTTVLLSTHQLDVAAEVGDLICFMQQGKCLKKIEAASYQKEELILELFSIIAEPEKA